MRERDILARRGDVGAGQLAGVGQRGDVGLRGRHRRVGFGDLQPVWLGVDAEQQVARLDKLAFLHLHVDDLADDLGADADLVLLEIGVIGADLALQALPVDEPADQQEARARLAQGPAVPGENPQVAAAKARRAEAELALRRTEVRAPISGRVAQSDRLQLGQQAVTSLPMLTIVADGSSYVEANFKETDLDEMRVGQPAQVRVDAYSGLVLKGHVASIGAGTGSEFSVLPAQNATGNWVKVTQRVPVRIAIDEKSPRPLIAGLSTEVTVFTDGRKL